MSARHERRTSAPTPILSRLSPRLTRKAMRGALVGMLLAAGTGMAWAAGPNGDPASEAAIRKSYSVPAGPLGDALASFAASAGVSVQVDSKLVEGRVTEGLDGSHSVQEGFALLLAGTGLEAVERGKGTYVLRPRPASGAAASPQPPTGQAAQVEPQLPEVSVEESPQPAAMPTMKGAITEGTGSYTSAVASVASKAPLSIRETPQSVTVITRERMDDQNLTSLRDALRSVGIKMSPIDQLRGDTTSRGFLMNTVLHDGLTTTLGGDNSIMPFDLAFYDRIEVLRGPAGLAQGAGVASGTVNLARKRAHDGLAVSATGQAGSWDLYRGQADLNLPLAESGRVRSRLVAVGEDRDFFYDVAEMSRTGLYGTLEVDLAPSTTLSLGSIHQDIRYTPSTGVPGHPAGYQLGLPRSTYLGAQWNRNDVTGTDTFAELEHRFESGGYAKLAARYIEKSQDLKAALPNQAFNPATGLIRLGTNRTDWRSEDVTVDAHLSMPLELFGRSHGFMAGTDYRANEFNTRGGSGPNLFQNVYGPSHDLPEPDIVLTSHNQNAQDQFGVYGQALVRPADRVLVILGGRLSWWDQTVRNLVTGVVTPSHQDREFTPYAGLVYELSERLSAYVSYTDIFQPTSSLGFDGTQLEPRVATQYEAGFKGGSLDGRLNGHLAVFRILDSNSPLADPAHPGFFVAAGDLESHGVEAEISGSPLPGWEVFANYIYTETEYLNAASAAARQQAGEPFSPVLPKHMFNLWTVYKFHGDTLSGFNVGGGLQVLSHFYNGPFQTVRFTQGGYAVVSAQLGYRFNRVFSANLTVNNLFDKVYFERVNNSTQGNLYGEPRSAMLTVRAEFK